MLDGRFFFSFSSFSFFFFFFWSVVFPIWLNVFILTNPSIRCLFGRRRKHYSKRIFSFSQDRIALTRRDDVDPFRRVWSNSNRNRSERVELWIFAYVFVSETHRNNGLLIWRRTLALAQRSWERSTVIRTRIKRLPKIDEGMK